MSFKIFPSLALILAILAETSCATTGGQDALPPVPPQKEPTRSIIVAGSDTDLQPAQIVDVIRLHIGEIQYCYEKQLVAQPDLSGRVVLQWVVDPSGHVESVTVTESSMPSDAVTRCMKAKVTNWRFAPPRTGATTVRFPFVFMRGSGPS